MPSRNRDISTADLAPSKSDFVKASRLPVKMAKTILTESKISQITILTRGNVMNVIWLILLSVSIVFAIFTGNLEAFTKSLFDGAKSAVEISLFLLGIVSLWMGITRILEDSGLIYRIAHAFKPIISRLFKNIPDDHPSITAITLNVLANLFG